MRKAILICVAACFYYSGLVHVIRWWTRRLGRRLIILNYHRATGGDLRRHLLYLRRHDRILHFEEALQELYSPQGLDRRIPLVLIVDDGHHDNYTRAFPPACEFHDPITIF